MSSGSVLVGGLCEAGTVLTVPSRFSKNGNSHGGVLSTALLRPQGRVLAPAVNSSFFVRSVFGVNAQSPAGVRLSGYSPGFRGWFVHGGNFIESSMGPATLEYVDFPEPATDSELIAGAGGDEKAVVGLAHVAALLTLHMRGKRSALHTDGRTNHFFVRRRSHRVTALRLRWQGEGWRVMAFDTSRIKGFMDDWSEGRFFWRALPPVKSS